MIVPSEVIVHNYSMLLYWLKQRIIDLQTGHSRFIGCFGHKMYYIQLHFTSSFYCWSVLHYSVGFPKTGLFSDSEIINQVSPFLQGCSPASWLPVCTFVWHYSVPRAALCIYLCWISCCCRLSSAPVYLGPSARLLIPWVNIISPFSVISKLARDAFNSCIQITEKNIEQNWSKNWDQGNTGQQPDVTPSRTTLWALTLNEFSTQRSMYLFISQSDNLSRIP